MVLMMGLMVVEMCGIHICAWSPLAKIDMRD
jgi:hypothetical protein